MSKSTNEEYALLIQKGHIEYYGELWENVGNIINLYAYRFYTQYTEQCIKNGITVDDLKQSGFIALTSAVSDFKPEKEIAFVTYLTYHIKNSFNSIVGLRTHKQDAFKISQSIDVPIGDESETTLAESIADPTDNYLRIEDRIFNEELSTALKECICGLPQDQEYIINGRYFKNLGSNEICMKLSINENQLHRLQQKALNKLRSGKNKKILKPFADGIFTRCIRSTGLNSFKNNRASSVELTVEFFEQ